MNALAGKTVLITRAQHQAKQMSVAVKERANSIGNSAFAYGGYVS